MRIYHPYDKWEDFKHGFYDNLSGKNKELLKAKVVELFTSASKTKKYMERVITEWPYSCEHNLTNESMNRVAYLGQSACCLYANIPSTITMEAWSEVPEENRKVANEIAERTIKKWETNNMQQCLRLN